MDIQATLAAGGRPTGVRVPSDVRPSPLVPHWYSPGGAGISSSLRVPGSTGGCVGGGGMATTSVVRLPLLPFVREIRVRAYSSLLRPG